MHGANFVLELQSLINTYTFPYKKSTYYLIMDFKMLFLSNKVELKCIYSTSNFNGIVLKRFQTVSFLALVSAAITSLNSLFLSRLAFAFLLLSCFRNSNSFFFVITSLSSPLYKTSSFSLMMSRARFRFMSTDLVWWHCGSNHIFQ